MASALSGLSRFAFGYVLGHFGALLKVSAVPFAIIAGLAVAYTQFTMNRVFDTIAQGGDPENVSYEWIDLIYTVVLLYFWMWLIAKVIRLVLSGETPGLIGSGGTLRAAAWFLLYYLGTLLILVVPAALIVVGLLTLLIEAGAGDGAALLASLAVFVVVVLIGWGMGRFFVGFQPVALGERPGFFSGWRLTRGVSWGLYLRVIAVLVAVAVVLTVAGYVLADALLSTMGTDGVDVPAEATPENTQDVRVLIQYLMAFQIGATVVLLPVYWFILVMFAESYRRLSEAG
ncbi:MAG: hypothetical protein ACR2PM_10575 [Hyphomicrobiales bacterium]